MIRKLLTMFSLSLLLTIGSTLVLKPLYYDGGPVALPPAINLDETSDCPNKRSMEGGFPLPVYVSFSLFDCSLRMFLPTDAAINTAFYFVIIWLTNGIYTTVKRGSNV
jgi:hypothetical protein